MPVIFVGVRHHSPACARLVAATIAAHRPAHVLVEGPADMNARLDELLLGHELPIAVFTSGIWAVAVIFVMLCAEQTGAHQNYSRAA